MRLVHPEIEAVFEWPRMTVPTLVIENQSFFRKFLKDIRFAIEGCTSPVVLSIADKPISIAKHVELLTEFLSFDLNQKTLLNKMLTELEKTAVSEEHYFKTRQLLSEIEAQIADWSFGFPCDITATKVTVSALLKACSVCLKENYEGEYGEVEKILDYMELVREFDRDKLFVTVNMRSWFSDEAVAAFVKTVLSHEYTVLMVEAFAHPLLESEQRVTIDRDLCEF